jgi:hypothetical protein
VQQPIAVEFEQGPAQLDAHHRIAVAAATEPGRIGMTSGRSP